MEQSIKENGGNLKVELQDPEFGREWKKDLADRKPIFVAFTKYTGYDLRLETIVEDPCMNHGFLLDLCYVWEREKKAEEESGWFHTPKILMNKVIDFCLPEGGIRNYVPPSFMKHRDSLPEEKF